MNTILPLGLLFLLASGAATVSAAPVHAPPPPPWAVPAVRSVVQKKIMSARPDGDFQGSKAVTRYELAVALDRFIRYIEAGRKPLHPQTSRKSLTVPADAGSAVRAAVIHLSAGSFLPSDSPLFRGKGNEPVTAQQLSDALADVTIRLSDRSLPPAQN